MFGNPTMVWPDEFRLLKYGRISYLLFPCNYLPQLMFIQWYVLRASSTISKTKSMLSVKFNVR